MLQDIVAANALGDYRLQLRFDDGVEGVVDLAPHAELLTRCATYQQLWHQQNRHMITNQGV